MLELFYVQKNEKVVEYSISRTMSPTLIAEYKLNLIDKKVLENKLTEISNIVEDSNYKDKY